MEKRKIMLMQPKTNRNISIRAATQIHSSVSAVLAMVNGYDPTRTISLRNQFARDMSKRFRRLVQIVDRTIVEEDCFAMMPGSGGFAVMAEMVTPGRHAFDFPRSGDKVTVFMAWLQKQEQAGILETFERPQLGTGIEQAWTNRYIYSAYQKGIYRARMEMLKAGYKVPSIEKSGGIDAVFNQPFHLDRVGLIYTRAYSGLKGITSQMDHQISIILAQAMADGKNPREMARLLRNTITGPFGDLGITDTLGRFIPAKRRAMLLARTEVIRAHHVATIQEYRNWAVAGVVVKAEWRTAGDNRVCEQCASLQKKVFTLDEIESKIPFHPQCFLDSQVPIYTSKGWLPIGKIVLGDMVLTHEGRFKKVTQLHRTLKQQPDVVKFGIEGLSNKTITMTANHPVLVDGKWKEAKDVSQDDKITLLANRCKRCGEPIPYFRGYCSRTCLSLDITDRQWSNPNHRKNISEKASAQMQKEYTSGERDRYAITRKANEKTRELAKKGKHPFQRLDVIEKNKLVTNLPHHRKDSSERMKKNNPMFNLVVRKKATISFLSYLNNHPGQRLNVRMAKHRKSGRKTWIEERMSLLLDKLGIDYIFQYPILKYDVDFAIPALKIVIECDGDHWHQNKEADNIRQERIEKEGWFVLRYTGLKINQCLDEIEGELSRVLMNHMGQYEFIFFPIRKIEKWKIKRARTLYNLSVEEDESYLAKGMVVHNCRCLALPVSLKEGDK